MSNKEAERLIMYDVAIIGAGISGASVARELSKYNLKTAVLEKGSDVCSGASRGNSATVHSGHDAAYGTKKAYYNVLGNAMYGKICEELSVPFVRNGMIVFAASDEQMQEIRSLKENADKNGVPDVSVFDRKDLNAVESGFGEDVSGGLYAPSSGMVCPYSLVIAMCENAAQNGAEFFLDTEVLDITKEEQNFCINTGKGELVAKYIFNCAGTHADDINAMVSKVRFKIIPRKGEHIILDKKLAPFVKTTICQTPFSLPGGGHSKGMGLMPSVDGTIILGCDAHEVSDKDDASTTSVGTGEILEFFEKNWKHFPIARHVPRFPRDMVIGAFGGLRPHPDSDDFIIGEAEDAEGFYNAAGIESPGITAAPAIAKELVQEAADKYGFEINEDFDPFRKHRKPFREMNEAERRAAVKEDENYGKIVCRCEQVTKAEVLSAIRSPIGARTVNAVKMRTRAGMGRCQSGFCGPEVVKILSEELGIPITDVTLSGEGSQIVPHKI